MATVVVGCMSMQSTIVERTGIIQIQPKSGLLPEVTVCQEGPVCEELTPHSSLTYCPCNQIAQ